MFKFGLAALLAFSNVDVDASTEIFPFSFFESGSDPLSEPGDYTRFLGDAFAWAGSLSYAKGSESKVAEEYANYLKSRLLQLKSGYPNRVGFEQCQPLLIKFQQTLLDECNYLELVNGFAEEANALLIKYWNVQDHYFGRDVSDIEVKARQMMLDLIKFIALWERGEASREMARMLMLDVKSFAKRARAVCKSDDYHVEFWDSGKIQGVLGIAQVLEHFDEADREESLRRACIGSLFYSIAFICDGDQLEPEFPQIAPQRRMARGSFSPHTQENLLLRTWGYVADRSKDPKSFFDRGSSKLRDHHVRCVLEFNAHFNQCVWDIYVGDENQHEMLYRNALKTLRDEGVIEDTTYGALEALYVGSRKEQLRRAATFYYRTIAPLIQHCFSSNNEVSNSLVRVMQDVAILAEMSQNGVWSRKVADRVWQSALESDWGCYRYMEDILVSSYFAGYQPAGGTYDLAYGYFIMMLDNVTRALQKNVVSSGFSDVPMSKECGWQLFKRSHSYVGLMQSNYWMWQSMKDEEAE